MPWPQNFDPSPQSTTASRHGKTITQFPAQRKRAMRILSRRRRLKTSGRQSGSSVLQSTIANNATVQFRALIFVLTTEVSWSFSDLVTSVFLEIPLQTLA